MVTTTPPDEPESNDQVERLKKLARDEGWIPEILGEDAVSEALNSKRPKIKLPGDNRELSQFAAEIAKHVKDHGMYRRDRQPVMINERKQRLDAVSSEMLRTWVEYHLVCFRSKSVAVGQGDQEQKITIEIVRTMNLDSARGTIEAVQFWSQLSEIIRINQTRLPIVRSDRRIELLKPGYFAEQGIYTLDDKLQLDEEMTKDEAVAYLQSLLKDFPFPNERSRAVAVAAMLTMFCATMLPRRAFRPGFIYTANSTGAGKTLLAKFAIIAVTGAAATRTFPRKEEAKKILDIIAMGAFNYALFDNIRGKIAGEEIEGFITSSEWEGRVLGSSTSFKVDNVTTVFLTGNQSTTSRDMMERCLFVELFVQEADSRDRKIPRVIDDTFLAEPGCRAKMLSSLWALVRAWEAAGKPPAPTVMPRFEAWSQIVAAITAHAGFGDPCVKPEFKGSLGQSELRDMTALVGTLAPDIGGKDKIEEWKFDAIIAEVVKLGLFADSEVQSGRVKEDMIDADGGISPAGKSYFGKLLTRYDNRVFGVEGRMLRFVVEGKGNSRRYLISDETPIAPSVPF